MSGKPRHSGIPTPGRVSAIPTPGRSRASSRAAQNTGATVPDVNYVHNAFADAIKANDPARHRTGRVSDVSTASLSPPSSSYSLSGRRSVSGRPSSVASSSSVEPPPVPSTGQSQVVVRPTDNSRVSSRNGRVFDVGDNVRIESLGFEGVLRFIGEIDGKPGLWAGVELSGGFAGKGKNNGSVNQKHYFTCPPNCGVFVSTAKLSAPTVVIGRRSSSVSSSRSGRMTPTTSGRVTPSPSTSAFPPTSFMAPRTNGWTTPSTGGRIAPSTSYGNKLPGITPSRTSIAPIPKSTPAQAISSETLSSTITAGSRASKYVSMTAKELKSRTSATTTPVKSHDSDATGQKSQTLTSAPLPLSSPFSTPRPSLNGRVSNIGLDTSPAISTKTRTPMNTPRGRISGAAAMPPPPSPSRSTALSNLSLELSPTRSSAGGYVSGLESSQLSTSVSSAAFAEQEAHVERLQSRLDASEYENGRLRSSLDELKATGAEATERETQSLRDRVSTLEERLRATEASYEEGVSEINTLQSGLADLERQREEREQDLVELGAKLTESAVQVDGMNEAIELKEARERELESTLEARNVEIVALKEQMDNLFAQFEDERQELGIQINELRQAGQETIALYEERLSEAEGQRYELEDRIAALDTRLRKALEPSQPTSPPSASAAAQIDNESLRDQIVYLQKKITGLEDSLDDVHSASEKELAALRDRLKRAKDKEDAMRKEMMEGRKELDQVTKLEVNARTRTQEIEEALRESTFALENARAEVEGTRNELANLDGVLADGKTGDLPTRLTEIVQGAAAERSRFTAEIARLNSQLETSRGAEQSLPLDLRSSLANQSVELHSLKKKLNREIPIGNGLHESFKPNGSPTSKHEYNALRDEITGLKHIVQDLQKENQAASQRNKLLEAENKLLLSENEQLRQDLKILEDNLDQSILREEQVVGGDSSSLGNGSLSPMPKDERARVEEELKDLRKRLSEAEMKNARLTHDLNKEISELETLVESKIYREDELEQELERTKEKLARYQKKASKGATPSTETLSPVVSIPPPQEHSVCEICERPGHDIFTCDLLKDDTASFAKSSVPDYRGNSAASSSLFCEDCESPGHLAADCPHSLDVF